MLLDLHAHSSGISRCCKIPAPAVLEVSRDLGLDGIVLTNHYQKSYVKDGTPRELAERYVAEYHYTRECGEKIGQKVFFGIEVTTELYPKVHMLVYGVPESFIIENPEVYDLTQEELYRLVKAAGGTLIQAHPFRGGTTPLDLAWLDGVEINCHPLYGTSCFPELTKIATDARLILTCGGDYHADTYRANCGTYLPDTVIDSVALGEYIRSTDVIRFRMQEPNREEINEVTYTRGVGAVIG